MQGKLGPYTAATPDDHLGSVVDFGHLDIQKQQQQQQQQQQQEAVKESLFTSFEDVKLSDEERVYLNAAALGDIAIVRQSIEDLDSPLNVNCVDYMGRSAIHLAVDCENMELVELLMERINIEHVEEALLHAISRGVTKIVKVIIEHPNYIAGSEQFKRTMKDPFFRTDEKSQFSPDITPLILAAHHNNHEIIQMFLYRNHKIEKPHPIYCQCTDCVTKQNYDSLKRSRSRLHAYKALASPAYMALSSNDPIMATFQLRQEMKKLAQVEKEFKNEYLSLVEQCMNFACELMDLCRGTQEVEAVLSEPSTDGYNPLERLKMAMEFEEKKFVAHPNCQQHLTSIWFGAEMGFMQSLALWKTMLFWMMCVPLVPILCLIYLISPHNKISNMVRCPAAKFITHTISSVSFLILLTAATFRLDEKPHLIDSVPDHLFERNYRDDEKQQLVEDVELLLKGTFRPANVLITNVQLCLIFYILGLLCMEYKQMYNTGLRLYLLDVYNLMDFSIISLYVASYVLRFLVDHWINQTNQYFDGVTKARDALMSRNKSQYQNVYNNIFNDSRSYFMKASRFDWKPDDPEIVSDILFAIANVLSIARTTFLMPAFEVLGTLQISLGRMLADITRFMVLFSLVLFAFMVGLHNLYWYYGAQTYIVNKDNVDKLMHTSEAFQGLPRTFYSLFWCMFGQVSLESIEIKYPTKATSKSSQDGSGDDVMNSLASRDATSVVEVVGMFLFALYHVAIIIVLINMLIAMMSHSFEAIQEDCDVEWKFARTRLWMNFINHGNTVPVPFNVLPAPKTLKHLWVVVKNWALGEKGRQEVNANGSSASPKKTSLMNTQSRREKICENLNISTNHTSNADMLQRLVRRYLFKLERMKEEGKDNAVVSNDANIINPATMAETIMGPDEPPDSNLAESDGLMSVGPRMPQRPRLQSRMSTSGRTNSSKPQIQLLSLPQLDSIQRTLKILDVRLQHVQSNVRDDEKQTQDIDHIRRLMTENQSCLTSVVTILSSIQDEVGSLRNLVTKQQANTFQIQPHLKSKSSSKHREDKKNSSSSTAHNDPKFKI